MLILFSKPAEISGVAYGSDEAKVLRDGCDNFYKEENIPSGVQVYQVGHDNMKLAVTYLGR